MFEILNSLALLLSGLSSRIREMSKLDSHNLFAMILLLICVPISPLSANNNFDLKKAARTGNLELVKLLVDMGTDVNAKGYGAATALHYASVNGHIDVVQFLIKQGADVNSADDKGGTALIYSVWKRHIKIVRILIKSGANVNAITNDGRTALGVAQAEGDVGIEKILREAGGN